jgi:carbon monoxide dehydrogenase subunit G
MQFENHFDVEAPLDDVWQTVLDVERVAPTVPGAKVLERTSDTAYKVAIKVKVGPMSMTYKGDVEIVERDDAAHRAVMRARAKESRGQGTADADVTMTLQGENGRTSATITTDVDLSGKVATMGQGVLQDVSGRLVETFAKNLAVMLEGKEEPAPAAAEQPAAAAPGEAPPAAEAPPKAPPKAAPQAEEALDLGHLGGAMAAEKLSEPRNLGIVIGIAMLIAYLLGRRSARR